MDSFLKLLKDVVEKVRKAGFNEAFIIHHDEADGVCSAAITAKALSRAGLSFKTICLDKLYPEVLKGICMRGGGLYLFTDIGSAHVKLIEGEMPKGSLTIILDHHDTLQSSRSDVLNVNPELYGLSGERDASASTVSYLFAKTLDASNLDLSALALIGAAEIPGPITGLNQLALRDALTGGFIQMEKEDFKIMSLGKPLSYKRYSTILSVLASVGYYRGGPLRALKACMDGFEDKDYEEASKLEEERKKANATLLSILRREKLAKMKAIQWFSDRGVYRGMGTKVIGSFCSYLQYQGFIDKDKYIVGYMDVPPDIPGYGRLEKTYVKISTRAPKPLADRIAAGEKPPLSRILPEACSKFRGFADGHTVAASGVVEKKAIMDALKALDELAS
ncbi:DHH family phosphoesterase [Candidatus Bathyarchaeota archaeon]|nr:DHH family phosphoesterase [Candidatus Bathyarchaeota archaeon]MBS7617932.1 DHH family phosphoesterase [Candidatus Bathyarchaeota archaeon]